MFQLLEIIFWASAGLTAYAYVGYPLLVFFVSRVFPKHVRRGEYEPAVSIIIAAYNEERDIREKLQNTLALNYPSDKLEIIVVSDCSTDDTDNIVREFASDRVKLMRQMTRRGKTAAQNLATASANGEVVLFSDATSMYQTDVLREMLPNFADPRVGCVAGKLVYVDKSESGIGDGARSYWNYETFLKESESRACSLIGVSGCMYAVRRSAYVPMYEEACSDFYICTMLYRQGLRTIYQPSAVCFEDTNTRTAEEFRMRVRIISQTFSDLWRNREMMNPANAGFYAVQLISHKLLRYAIPLFLALTLFSSAALALSSTFYAVTFALQMLFYVVALADWYVQTRGIDLKLVALPRYFCVANIASVAGFYNFIKGERFARWEPIRDRNGN